MSGHLSVGEELVTGQGPLQQKQKEDHQSPNGRGQRTSVFITPVPEGLDCC
jgi:hypothetical protein